MQFEDRYFWMQDVTLGGLHERLSCTPRQFRVVSFDFFDTLVYRLTSEPGDHFHELGHRLRLRRLLKQPLSADEFYHVRKAADERARQAAQRGGGSTEVQLIDIYRELHKVVTSPERAAEIEKQVELDYSFINPVIASLVRYLRGLGFATVIISDTYYTRQDLLRILRHHSFNTAHFDHIWVSCEHGCAKYDQGLFRLALSQLRIHGNEMLHIGDNLIADVEGPAACGIEPYYYYRTALAHEAVFRTEEKMSEAATCTSASANSLRVLASRLNCAGPEDPRWQGAMVFGPVLTRFADWALERFQRAGVRRVLALMREGELLGELLRRAASARQAPLEIVTCFASRKSTALASLGKLEANRLRELLTGGPILSIRDIFEILGIGDEAERILSPEKLSTKITTHPVMESLIRLLVGSEHLRALIEKKMATLRPLAFEYLAGLTGDEHRIGVMDLGWSGSIQKNIAQILRFGGKEITTVGCYLATTVRSGRLALDGDEIHGYLTNSWARRTLVPEIAITACIGSTDAYQRDEGGRVAPVLGPFEVDESEVHTKSRLREGILTFQELWLRKMTAAVRDGAGWAEICQDIDRRSPAILYRLLDFPTRDEALSLGHLEHDENYGVWHRKPLCDAESAEILQTLGLLHLWTDSHCYWPEGVVARQNPRLIHMLAHRWDSGTALGRAGVNATRQGKPTSLTEEELHYLEQILAAFAPAQLIYFGSGMPGDNVFLLDWLSWRQAASSGAVPVHAGAKNGMPAAFNINMNEPQGPVLKAHPEIWQTGGKDLDLDFLMQLRKCIHNDAPALVVLSGAVPAVQTTSIINVLAPFLPPGSMMATCHGILDPRILGHPGFHSALATWVKTSGSAMGYSLADSLFKTKHFRAAMLVAVRAKLAQASNG